MRWPGNGQSTKTFFRRIHGRSIGSRPSDALNARATRAIHEGSPDVLPWGAWAEFAQRHLAMFVGKSDHFYRHTLGSDGRADTHKQRLKQALRSLTLFPVATIFWTKGPKGGEADLAFINQAIAVAARAPERFDNPSQVVGFYYRAVNVRKQTEYEAAWKTALGRVFPGGLVAAPTGAAHPVHGVVVTRDNEKARKAGLQAGDIIVGLEGWRVDNLAQYRAVNAFHETNRMKLSVWRGQVYPVTIAAPNRMIGIEFRSNPIEGWSER